MIEIIEKSRLIKMEKLMRRSILLILIFIGLNQIQFGQQRELVLQISHSSCIEAITYSLDGKILATGGCDKTIKIWDVATGQNLRTLTGHSSKINNIIFSPDSKILASRSISTIKLWDVNSGKELKSLPNPKMEVKIGTTTTFIDASISNNLSFTSDGKMLTSGDYLWDIESGQVTKLNPRTESVDSLMFSEDGKMFATSYGYFPDERDTSIRNYEIKLWDTTTKTVLKILKGHTHIITSLKFSPDEKLLASGSVDQTIKLWDVASGKLIETLRTETEEITLLVFLQNGKTLASVNWGKTIDFWNVSTAKKIKTFVGFPEVMKVAFSPDGKTFAVCGETKDKNLFIAYFEPIRIFDTNTGTKLRSFFNESIENTSLAFSPNGLILGLGFKNGDVKLWNLKSEKGIKTLSSDARWVNAVTFSNDGKMLASVGNTIKIWDLNSEKEINSFGVSDKVGGFQIVAFSGDGKLLATNEGLGGDVAVWNVETGEKLKSFEAAFAISLTALAFSADGKALVTISKFTIKIWDLEGNELKSFPLKDFEKPEVLSEIYKTAPDLFSKLKFSPISSDLRFMAQLAENGKFNLYVLDNQKAERKLLISLSLQGKNDWLITTPEGFFDGTPNAWKQLIWRFNNNTFDYGAVELYFNEFFYPNLLQDVLAGKSPQAKAGSELEKIDRRQPKVEIVSVGGQSKEQINAQTVNQSRTAKVLVEVVDNVSEKKQANHEATGGAQDLRVFRNGSLVKVWHDDVFKLGKADGCEQFNKPNEARRVRCAVDVPIVAGENNFSAYAFNLQNVKSEDDAVSVKGADALKRDGTLYVLAVGVNKYQNANYNLNFAVPDVVDISRAIEAEQKKLGTDANLKQYAKTEIITLKDETATKDNILLALKRFAKDEGSANLPENLCAKLKENLCNELKSELAKIKPTQPEDALLIYYAGHGTSREQRFYLLPHNFTGAKELEKQAVSDLELNEYLEKVDAGKLLMVIDACQSGQALGAKDEGRAPMNSKGLAQLAYDKGMLILTAAQSYQAALEAPRIGDKKIEHGLLTYALLEAFSNKEADKDTNLQIWEREWFDFAVGQVPLLQREAMRQRNAEIKQTGRGTDIYYLDEDKNAKPEDRSVQTPRVFYRRETETNPLVVANP